jgi:Uma2 family endonuclease
MILRRDRLAMIAHAFSQSDSNDMAMPQTISWTREDLDRLPDDGNRYEVLNGELFVTPAPSEAHQAVVYWLNAVLTPFVAVHGLGQVQFPRGVIVIGQSQVEPDLMVRPLSPLRGWENAPVPILVIEVISKTTRRRDLNDKRVFYMEKGVDEYWVVDREARAVVRITPAGVETLGTMVTWAPKSIEASLDIDVVAMFSAIA